MVDVDDVYGSFIDKKKSESKWLALKNGETVKVTRLLSVKPEIVNGFGGQPKDVLRFTCEVETTEGLREKWFDNGTKKFTEEVLSKKVKVGSSFKLTRDGEGTKTKYILTEVVNPAPAAAPAAPAAPKA